MATGTINAAGVKTITPTVTKTSGASSFSSGTAAVTGNVVCLSLTFNVGHSTTAVGSNAFVGTISNVPMPKVNLVGTGYYSSTVLLMAFTTAGAITVRVLGAQKPASTSSTYTISVTYVSE